MSIVDAGRAGKLDKHVEGGEHLLDWHVLSDLAYRWLDEDRDVDEAQDAALAILEGEGRTWEHWGM